PPHLPERLSVVFIVEQVEPSRRLQFGEFGKDSNVRLDFLPNCLKYDDIVAKSWIGDDVDLIRHQRVVEHQVVWLRNQLVETDSRIVRQVGGGSKPVIGVQLKLLARQ